MPVALFLALLLGVAVAAEEPAGPPAAKEADPLARLAGMWVETSVVYSGEELLEPGRTSNLMTITGAKFTESGPSGKPFLRGEVKLVKAGKDVLEIDFPRRVIDRGTLKTVTVRAIVRPVAKDKLQIAYFDPALNPPGKRPDAFVSTPANGVVLITLRRQ